MMDTLLEARQGKANRPFDFGVESIILIQQNTILC